MYSQFQASYQRVEASLQKLTDSIAAYNPSTAAADELLAADETVNENLEHCKAAVIEHQKNYIRIQELRNTADSLDETIKSTLRLLVDARKEIQSIPSVDVSETRREVQVDEVLKYAKFISTTTVPPTFRKPLPSDRLPTPQPGDTQITNGMATPPSAVRETGDPVTIKTESGNVGLSAVDERARAWLHPEQTLPFEPWVSHGAIQASALAEIQKMLESGQDPGKVLTAEQREEAERRRKEDEEREQADQEAAERRRREVFDVRRRNTVVEGEVFNPDDL